MSAGLAAGFTVGVTADRRWEEQARLFRDRGGDILHGPALRTVDLSDDEGLRAITAALIGQPPDYLVVTTGMGMRRWLEAAARWQLDTDLLAALGGGTKVVARGAKAYSAARGAGLAVWWKAPHETMQEIVEHLSAVGIDGARVALQLFDPDGNPSTEVLRGMAGELMEVPVYQWAVPEDAGPAEGLIRAAVSGALGAVTFTAQPAVHNLFRIADGIGMRQELRAALNGPVVAACVGPVCATAANDEGVEHPVWPDPPRLPAMVRQVVERLADS